MDGAAERTRTSDTEGLQDETATRGQRGEEVPEEHAPSRRRRRHGLTLLLQSRAATLRTRGVGYRRFTALEPSARVGLAYRTPPTQHSLDLAADHHGSIAR